MNSYHALSIFYLSGTGNALKATLCFEQQAQLLNIETHVISVDRQKKANNEQIANSDIIGLCYPTHGFSLPWHMLRFILSLPKSKDKHFFLLNTRAGSKLFNLFLPGISGIAQWLPLFILWFKGYKCRGLFPLDMPSNWISIHPGFSSKTVHSITAHCMALTVKFASRILSGNTVYRPIAFVLLPLDIFLIPIAMGYMLAGRFFIAKTFIADYSCDNCDLCIINCPVGAIEKKFKRPFWTINCESCMRCINICPKHAIQTAHGYVTLFVFAFLYIPFFAISSDFIMSYISTGISFIDGLLDLTVFTIIAIPFLLTSYYLVAYLQRFKASSFLFRYTSLTYFWKHYIASGINAGSFRKGKHNISPSIHSKKV